MRSRHRGGKFRIISRARSCIASESESRSELRRWTLDCAKSWKRLSRAFQKSSRQKCTDYLASYIVSCSASESESRSELRRWSVRRAGSDFLVRSKNRVGKNVRIISQAQSCIASESDSRSEVCSLMLVRAKRWKRLSRAFQKSSRRKVTEYLADCIVSCSASESESHSELCRWSVRRAGSDFLVRRKNRVGEKLRIISRTVSTASQTVVRKLGLGL